MNFELINKATKESQKFTSINTLKVYLILEDIPYNLTNPQAQRRLKTTGKTESICKKFEIRYLPVFNEK